MISDETTPLVIDITKSFVRMINGIDPKWTTSYFRFSLIETMCESKGSYAHESGIEIINVLKNKDFFHSVNDKGRELFNQLGKTQGVFLLSINSAFEYQIKFEYQNLDRWKISKLNGGTGIPENLEI